MSWEELYDCPCYKFAIVSGTQNIKQEINHNYTLTLDIKRPDNTVIDTLKFNKTLVMNTEVEHTLSDWAAVYTGQIDDFIATSLPPTYNQWSSQLFPWAVTANFHGQTNALTAELDNRGATMATSKIDSK